MSNESGQQFAIIDRPIRSTIRGLHYIDGGPAEDAPPMADILNPDAVTLFIQLVHEKYARHFGQHFGKTVMGIFTDEPNTLGKVGERNVWPGTRNILDHVNRILGEDFTANLPALFDDTLPDANHHRQRYRWAIRRRLEETWYKPLSDWCRSRGLWLMGHPDKGD
ncbi:MAG: hypothetical protein GC164_09955 [Phycisphaera sp.]|nr:hypothetical protein [Phycisphaera sp.]